MLDEDNPKRLGRDTYLNPEFMPSYRDEENMRKYRASCLAYDLKSIVAAAHSAFENDDGGIPMEQRGVGPTLEIAIHMAGDLVDVCERLEMQVLRNHNGKFPET